MGREPDRLNKRTYSANDVKMGGDVPEKQTTPHRKTTEAPSGSSSYATRKFDKIVRLLEL